jgi:hypothetical protein
LSLLDKQTDAQADPHCPPAGGTIMLGVALM